MDSTRVFNSLDAQHEASEAYIRSQAHDGWTMVRTRYDDGGYSGGSTERPALQTLLADIRDRRIDVVVVYKVLAVALECDCHTGLGHGGVEVVSDRMLHGTIVLVMSPTVKNTRAPLRGQGA
jgi:hypothetical protein